MQVPKGWEIKLLGDVSYRVMVGIASAATHAYTNSGITMLRNLNIKEGWIDDSDILYITPEYEKSHKNKRLKAGDILTVRTGYPGVSAVVSEKYNDAQCFTSLITRLKQNIAKPEFVCLYINSDYGKRFITSGEAGGAQKNVNAGMLKKMPVPIPPLNVQQKIVQILSTWDKAIATTEQLLSNSKQQKKALMQQLLTGKKRLLDNSGQRFSGEWRKIELGKLVKEIKRPVIWDDNAEYKLLSVKRRSEGVVLRETLRGSQILTKKMNITKTGDFLISKMQVLHGASGLVTEAFDGFHISDSYICLRAKDEKKLDMVFFSWFSKQRLMYHKAFLCSYGVHIEKMTFNFRMYLKEKISIPSDVKEQHKIATVLTIADNEITQLQQKLDQLKQEKRALMQQLLTGRRRVCIKGFK